MLKLVEEVEKRLPANLNVFKTLDLLKPGLVTSAEKPRFTEIKISAELEDEEEEELEDKWRGINQENWRANPLLMG